MRGRGGRISLVLTLRVDGLGDFAALKELVEDEEYSEEIDDVDMFG